jgi:hypothetical protein
MRTLDVRNENGEVDETSIPDLWSVSFYPDDTPSRLQCSKLLRSLKSRFSFADDSYEATKFEQTILSAHKTGEGVRVAAGIVTIFLYRLALQEEVSPTKYQAAKYAELFIKRSNKVGSKPLAIPWRQGTKNSYKHFSLRTGRNNLTSAFEQYRTIGPLMAARVITAHENGHSKNLEEVRFGLRALLEVTQEIENVVFSAYPKYFENAWQVSNALPVDFIRIEPLDTVDRFVKSFPLK